jgi:acetyl esterase/lipase
MRKWLQEYISKLETKPLSKRHRPEVEICISDVQVEYGTNDRFSLRIYTPSEATKSPRPVLVAIHGGGWVLGLTAAEDGKAAPIYPEVQQAYRQ